VPLGSRHPDLFPASVFNYQLYKRAFLIVQSRFFNTEVDMSLPLSDSPLPPENPLPPRPHSMTALLTIKIVLVPLLESINHAPVYPHCNDSPSARAFSTVQLNGKPAFKLVALLPVFIYLYSSLKCVFTKFRVLKGRW
jgi:hypothetical protein